MYSGIIGNMLIYANENDLEYYLDIVLFRQLFYLF